MELIDRERLGVEFAADLIQRRQWVVTVKGSVFHAFGRNRATDLLEFERELPSLGEPYFFSTKASVAVWDAPLGASDGVVLVFGRETGGLPADLHERYAERFVNMPIHSPHVRSLNLSTSVAIAVYEVLRQRRPA